MIAALLGRQSVLITVSPDEAFLYVANQGSNDVFAYAINGTSSALAAVSGSPFPGGCHAVGNCDAGTAVILRVRLHTL
ncbi:MAG TPA: hypothetical protein VL261_12490 [Nitrospira sp.]|nr:hypothetical protein [Nitrospira sp.]